MASPISTIFFLHIFWKKTFADKSHSFLQADVLPVTQPTVLRALNEVPLISQQKQNPYHMYDSELPRPLSNYHYRYYHKISKTLFEASQLTLFLRLLFLLRRVHDVDCESFWLVTELFSLAEQSTSSGSATTTEPTVAEVASHIMSTWWPDTSISGRVLMISGWTHPCGEIWLLSAAAEVEACLSATNFSKVSEQTAAEWCIMSVLTTSKILKFT